MKPSDLARDPIFLDPATAPFIDGDGVAHLFSHAHVLDAMRNADRIFSRDFSHVMPPEQRVHLVWSFMWASGATTANGSAGRHSVLRKLVEGPFKKRAVEALGPTVRSIAEELVREAVQRGSPEVDLAVELAYPTAVHTINSIMGISREHEPWIQEQILQFQNLTYAETLQPEPPELTEYLWRMVNERRKQPRDQLVDGLIAAWSAGDITDLELLAFILNFWMAAADVGTNIAIAVGLLAEFDLLDEAKAHLDDGDGQWWQRAGEEILRYGTPFAAIPVTAIEEATRGELRIPAGTPVMLWLTAANRDPAINGNVVDAADPSAFDVTRWPNQHIAFGWGPYRCLGAELARHATPIAVEAALRYLPDLRPDDRKPYLRRPGFTDHILSAPFTFDPDAAARAVNSMSAGRV